MKLEFTMDGPVKVRILHIQETKAETSGTVAEYSIDAEITTPGLVVGWGCLRHTSTPRPQEFRKEGFTGWTMYPQGNAVTDEHLYAELEAAVQRRKWDIAEKAPLHELAETEL